LRPGGYEMYMLIPEMLCIRPTGTPAFRTLSDGYDDAAIAAPMVARLESIVRVETMFIVFFLQFLQYQNGIVGCVISKMQRKRIHVRHPQPLYLLPFPLIACRPPSPSAWASSKD